MSQAGEDVYYNVTGLRVEPQQVFQYLRGDGAEVGLCACVLVGSGELPDIEMLTRHGRLVDFRNYALFFQPFIA